AAAVDAAANLMNSRRDFLVAIVVSSRVDEPCVRPGAAGRAGRYGRGWGTPGVRHRPGRIPSG
ncbi:MAG: hypothetical protein ACREM1_20750, partial [Longimicrobiales bacterium]